MNNEEEKMPNKTSSGDDSETNSDNFAQSNERNTTNSSNMEDVRLKMGFVVQLLNKFVAIASSFESVVGVKDAIGTYIGMLFDTTQNESSQISLNELTNTTFVTLRSLNLMFITEAPDVKEQLSLLFKF